MCRDGEACQRECCFFAHSIGELRRPTPEEMGPLEARRQAAAQEAAKQKAAAAAAAPAAAAEGKPSAAGAAPRQPAPPQDGSRAAADARERVRQHLLSLRAQQERADILRAVAEAAVETGFSLPAAPAALGLAAPALAPLHHHHQQQLQPHGLAMAAAAAAAAAAATAAPTTARATLPALSSLLAAASGGPALAPQLPTAAAAAPPPLAYGTAAAAPGTAPLGGLSAYAAALRELVAQQQQQQLAPQQLVLQPATTLSSALSASLGGADAIAPLAACPGLGLGGSCAGGASPTTAGPLAWGAEALPFGAASGANLGHASTPLGGSPLAPPPLPQSPDCWTAAPSSSPAPLGSCAGWGAAGAAGRGDILGGRLLW